MTGPSLASYTSNPQSKPSPTSHPLAYGPPQPLEPPTNGTASGSASPHMTAMGWGSPNHNLPSPSAMVYHDYQEPAYGNPAMYGYPGSIRRPQSTEPEDYGIRPRGSHAQHMAHAQMQSHVPTTADWSSMPTGANEMRQDRHLPFNMHDIKQERYVM